MPVPRTIDPAQMAVSMAIVLGILVIHVVLATRALTDLADHGGRVRIYSERVWRTLIIVVGIIGPVAYFELGRDDRS